MIFEKIKEKIEDVKGWEDIDGKPRFTFRDKQMLEIAIYIVNQVGTEYNNGWIYCSSGQFPKDDDYILYCGNHLANMEVDCCIGEWFLNHLEYMLAWQPLPQPPKGE